MAEQAPKRTRKDTDDAPKDADSIPRTSYNFDNYITELLNILPDDFATKKELTGALCSTKFWETSSRGENDIKCWCFLMDVLYEYCGNTRLMADIHRRADYAYKEKYLKPIVKPIVKPIAKPIDKPIAKPNADSEKDPIDKFLDELFSKPDFVFYV